MCIAIICCPVYNAINFKVNRRFLSRRFPIQPKRHGKKFKSQELFHILVSRFSSFLKGFY